MAITDPIAQQMVTPGTVPGSSQQSQQSWTTSSVPEWQMQALKTVVGQGAAIAGQDYVPYGGQRIADFSPDQLNAQQLFRYQAAGTQADPTQVQSNIDYSLSGFNPEEVKKYLSPYTTGVIDEIGRLGNQNLTENILPGINSTFTGAGQFGSTRNADFTNRAVRDTQYDILGQQSNALQNAQTSALQQYGNWHNQALQNAQTATGLGAQTASNLSQAGSLQQTADQANLNLAYQDFQNQQNFPKSNLGWYADLLNANQLTGQKEAGSTSSGSSTTGYTPGYVSNVYGTSPAQTGLSAASTIYGLS